MDPSGREAARAERRQELLDLWATGKQGEAVVLSLCQRALPKGETLNEGMSVFDVILDHEFGKPVPPTKMDDSERGEKPSVLLERALRLFRGHAAYAYLGEIHQVAVEQIGFEGSLEEAAEALAKLPNVRVERAPVLAQSSVFASAYWSATT